MATKKTKDAREAEIESGSRPTVIIPAAEPEAIPKQVTAQDRLDQLVKDQEAHQAAYVEDVPSTRVERLG